MNYKHSLLGLVAGTALVLAGGCGKPESPATPAADNTTRAPAPAAVEKSPAVEAPKTVSNQPAVAAQPEAAAAVRPVTAITAAPVAGAPAVAAAGTNPVAAISARAGTNQPMATTSVASGRATNGTFRSTLQTALQPQSFSLAQTGTNQLQMLAGAATNQALMALGMTNQVTTTGTNQVQALLDRAKTLSANQKYQEALDTLTQLYATKLTPDQKVKADDLKAQIQTSLTQKATSALGSFLGGKK